MNTWLQTLIADPLTLISLLISAISLALAVIQTLRIRRNRREQKIKLWSLIASSKSLMEDMEEEDPKQAAGKIYELFRSLLKEAILLENSISVKKLNGWRMVGKLSSDWQHRQALALLQSHEINLADAEKLSIDFQIWDSNPRDNSFNHHDDRIDKSRKRYRKNKYGIAVTIDELKQEEENSKS